MFKPTFYEINPKSWEDAKLFGSSLVPYIFRGHSNTHWKLKTSLERANEKFQNNTSSMGYYENVILRKFKTRAHQFVQSPPDNEDVVEWLSIIQHYGGSTRLLDFTESFYIASFFAVDMASNDSCIWAINQSHLENSAREKIGDYGSFNWYPDSNQNIYTIAGKMVTEITSEREVVVLPLVPSRLNERLAVQRGLFLFPSNVFKSFEENLCIACHLPFLTFDSINAVQATTQVLENFISDIDLWPSVIKINLRKEWHREIIRDLYTMNIDAASLFPGLEGFARSLSFLIQSDLPD